MAYAALLSGFTLAQVGLGSVHGLASPLGAYFPIPHGVVCGTLVAAATRANIRALQARDPVGPAIGKYGQVGRLLAQDVSLGEDESLERLVAMLTNWTRRLGLPALSRYGVGESDLDTVVANCRGSSMKTNPIVLTDGEVRSILVERL
jgi:alcohol dehydrogenase